MKFKKTIGVLLLVSIILGMMTLPIAVSGAEVSPAQEYLDKQMEDYNVNGVAYITKNGKVIAQSTRGMANTSEGKEVTIDTLFPIGSNSKQFCAVAIFMLNEQGKLSLDDTLSKYFPEYTAGADVTIRQMLTMRSGIRDFQEGAFREFEPTVGGTQEENQQKILDWLNTKKLKFKPGGGYGYSNTNMLLLSMIIEKITGESYENFIKENIFAPLGMVNSGFYEELVNHPDLCENKFPDLPSVVSSIDTKGCFQGSGDLVTNAKDMDRWLTSLRECTLISAESMEEMTTVYTTNVEIINGIGVGYAYGIQVTADNGVCHGGFIDTYVSATLSYFEEKVNVFVVANDDQSVQIDMQDLAHRISVKLKETKICGDVNTDMNVNVKDATVIQKASAELITLSEIETLCANVNGDSVVNVRDATEIQKYVAGFALNSECGKSMIITEDK